MVSEPPEGCTNGFMAPGSELVPFWMETNMNVWLYFWLYYGYIMVISYVNIQMNIKKYRNMVP